MVFPAQCWNQNNYFSVTWCTRLCYATCDNGVFWLLPHSGGERYITDLPWIDCFWKELDDKKHILDSKSTTVLCDHLKWISRNQWWCRRLQLEEPGSRASHLWVMRWQFCWGRAGRRFLSHSRTRCMCSWVSWIRIHDFNQNRFLYLLVKTHVNKLCIFVCGAHCTATHYLWLRSNWYNA